MARLTEAVSAGYGDVLAPIHGPEPGLLRPGAPCYALATRFWLQHMLDRPARISGTVWKPQGRLWLLDFDQAAA